MRRFAETRIRRRRIVEALSVSPWWPMGCPECPSRLYESLSAAAPPQIFFSGASAYYTRTFRICAVPRHDGIRMYRVDCTKPIVWNLQSSNTCLMLMELSSCWYGVWYSCYYLLLYEIAWPWRIKKAPVTLGCLGLWKWSASALYKGATSGNRAKFLLECQLRIFYFSI